MYMAVRAARTFKSNSYQPAARKDRVIPLWVWLLVVLLLIWEIAGRTSNGGLLPPLSKVILAWIDLMKSGELPKALLTSLEPMFIGFFIAMIVAIPLGVLIGWYRWLEYLLDIYLDILISVPMAALVPVIIMVFGIGTISRIIIIFLFSFVITTVNTANGVKQVQNSLLEMAHSFHASERQIFHKILIPSAMPMILSGVRLGFGRAIYGMVVAELLITSVGLGGLILQFNGEFRSDETFAVVLSIAIVAVLLLRLVQLAERYLVDSKYGRKGRV